MSRMPAHARLTIRAAEAGDLELLDALQARCQMSDRLSRRSLRYLLSKANAHTLIAECLGVPCGFALLLFNAGTSMARLYAFGMDHERLDEKLALRLLNAVEQAARGHDAVWLRTEVRRDNAGFNALFVAAGYRQFETSADYYEDHMDALRYEKLLAGKLAPALTRVPYFRQTLDFTCGPATLMMAMKSLDSGIALDRKLEIRIWREATTVFMTSGHGGCGPYGLALSAHRRGFQADVYVNDDAALFVDSVRSGEKKEVIRLVQEDFLDEIRRSPIRVRYQTLSLAEMQRQYDQGGIPIVLISSYRIYREKAPHWVVVTGFDERFIYVHDPLMDSSRGHSLTDRANMPILKRDFERMARYGKQAQKAVIVLRRRGALRVASRARQA
jgi:predicted double-glycine peptidase/ribosomal protein S18 acetylase RimI-like enzyme